jgi:two-component system nitrogen regulation sensor histidine kinase GlnL
MASRRALRPAPRRGSAGLAAAPTGPAGVAATWPNVLASLDEAIVIADTAERITFVNQAAETLTGTSAAQAKGRPLVTVFPRDAWLVAMVVEAVRSGAERVRAEGALASGAALVPVAVTISPILDAAGLLEGAAIVLHDLRHRKDLDEVSRHADRTAALELLTAGLAHEIKNPLGAIRGAAQLLQHHAGADAAVVLEHTDVIVREVDRLSRLLDELRALASPPPLHLEPVNIHKVLHAVLEIARKSPAWQATAFEAQFDPSLPEVWGNEQKLVQVFLNLVTNALHAMGGTGKLSISTRMVTDYHVRPAHGGRGRFLAVVIEDTGPGIGAGDPANLFAPFFTTKPGGSGLGLAICQQIVTQHNGRIWLRNRRGGPGAAARVLLPLAGPLAGPRRPG